MTKNPRYCISGRPCKPLTCRITDEAKLGGEDSISQLLPEFKTTLTAQNKSLRTVEAYEDAARLLDKYLAEEGLPRQIKSITRSMVERFIGDQIATRSKATAAIRYRSLQQFFKWAVGANEIEVSPMREMKPPNVVAPEIPVIGPHEITMLLKACHGKTLPDYRDAALIRLFVDTGARLSEVTNLRLEDVNLETNEIRVLGKGNRERRIGFGDATRKALRLYLTARTKHSQAHTEWLWLGARGQELTASGVQQIVRRRCDEAGIARINVHRFRHTAADHFFSHNMSPGDAMKTFGWKSVEMTFRYASSTAAERARESARRIGYLGDGI